MASENPKRGDKHLKPDHSQFNLSFSKLLPPNTTPHPSSIQLGNRDLVEWLEELLRHLLTHIWALARHHSHLQVNLLTL